MTLHGATTSARLPERAAIEQLRLELSRLSPPSDASEAAVTIVRAS